MSIKADKEPMGLEMMEKIDKKKILKIIIVLAILVRLLFIIKTSINPYQYDMGLTSVVTKEDYEKVYAMHDKEPFACRHIDYILRLYEHKGFPAEVRGQFYQPPLHHFIMAGWLHVVDLISDSASFKLESMQFVTFAYSVVILIAIYKILGDLNISDEKKIVPMLLVSFFPLFIYMAGCLNNDELVTMFGVLTILYVLKWLKDPTYKNAILISIFMGLGMMTKSIMILFIIPVGIMYFIKMNSMLNEDKKVLPVLIQLCIFIAVFLVLGGWYHVYSMIHQRDTFGIISPYFYLSVENYSIFERFGPILKLQSYKYNVWPNLVFISVFFDNYNVYGIAIVVLTAILSILSIIAWLRNIKENLFFILTILIWWMGYFYLNLSMPYYCSMNARYMAVPFMLTFAYMGMEKNEKLYKYLKIFSYAYSVFCIMFMIFFR